MAVNATKANQKNGRASVSGKRKKVVEDIDPKTILTEIENDPNAPQIARGLVALRRKRDQSGEPYITIEQMWEELERE